ncbi:MAG: nuclear transport factor 2 family protein [Gemmatimonadales bacterium]|nr:nuclear transport factor 2 family protein [Gemmatimonadales bacterium]
MRMIPGLAGLALFLTSTMPTAAAAQATADRDGVRRAVLDYVEGFYEGDTTKFLRSVRPEVDKFGFWKNDQGKYQSEGFPWPRFFEFARRVREGKTKTPPNAPKEVTVFEVQDQTAAAKVRAYWGTDYFLLARYDGRWMIRHVLWQDLPAKP